MTDQTNDSPVDPLKPPEINGWKPPLTYDIGMDSYRIATQRDLDNYASLGRAYGELRTKLKEIEDIHISLMAVVNRN